MKVLFLFATIIGITYSAPQAPPTVPTPPTAPTLPPIQLFTLVYLGGPCQRLGEKRSTLPISDVPTETCECKAHPFLYGAIYLWTDCQENKTTTTTSTTPSSSTSTPTTSTGSSGR